MLVTNCLLVSLSAVISLVYSASRYESPERIIKKALRLFLTIVGCMFCLLLTLWLLSYNL